MPIPRRSPFRYPAGHSLSISRSAARRSLPSSTSLTTLLQMPAAASTSRRMVGYDRSYSPRCTHASMSGLLLVSGSTTTTSSSRTCGEGSALHATREKGGEGVVNYLVADNRYLALRGEKEFNLAVVMLVGTLAKLVRSCLAYSVRLLRNRPSSKYSVGMCWSIPPTFMRKSTPFLVL